MTDIARGAVLHELGIRFRSGNTDELRADNLEQINRRNIDTVDLVEAGERIKASRTTSTYPPLAEILKHCFDARFERLAAEYNGRQGERDVGPKLQAFTEAHQEYMRRLVELREHGINWCDACGAFRSVDCHYEESRKMWPRADYHGPTIEQVREAHAFNGVKKRERTKVQPRSNRNRKRNRIPDDVIEGLNQRRRERESAAGTRPDDLPGRMVDLGPESLELF